MAKLSSGMTAAELMKQLAADSDYQAMVAQKEKQSQARADALSAAETPILADLADVGIDASSVWDVVNTSTPYPQALPVLINHLRLGGYPDRSMEGMGRALAVKPSVQYWDELRELYVSVSGSGAQQGLAVALSVAATKAQVGDLIDLVKDGSRDDSRLHFLRPIRKLGGPDGIAFVETLVGDPTFGREASAVLARLSYRQ